MTVTSEWRPGSADSLGREKPIGLAREQLLEGSMRSFGSSFSLRSRAAHFCGVFAVLFLCCRTRRPALPASQTRRRSRWRSSRSRWCVRWFTRSAAPVVHNAPRILAATAAGPIKAAYYAPPRLRPRPPRAERVYESEDESERETNSRGVPGSRTRTNGSASSRKITIRIKIRSRNKRADRSSGGEIGRWFQGAERFCATESLMRRRARRKA